MSADLQQALEIQRIWERTTAHLVRGRPGPCALRNAPKKSNRGVRPKPLFLAATESRLAQVADEPRMALAFFVRRMEGVGWDMAAADTAEEFGLAVKRRGGIVISTRGAESRIERAAETWRTIVLAYLIGVFPEHARRLCELMRERRT